MGKTTRGLAGSFGALIAAVGFAAPALAWSTPLWIRQFGTPASEYAEDAATDEDGNVYVVGVTEGSLFGRNQGSGDGWVAKFDATGHKLWAQQIGTDQYDRATGVATDADGNVYVVGGLDAGNVAKYDAAGHRIWEQRIDGYPSKVATDKDGNAFVGSVTFDGEYGVSLAKLDGLGRLLWTRELPLGGASDYVSGVAADEEGNIYLAGSTDTSEAGYSGPAWVYKFESDGDTLWTWEISDGDRHRARGVATDKEGNAYVVGYSAPSPFVANQAAVYGSWLIKFDAGGDTLWRRQISEGDSANDVATDEQGNAYLAGARYRHGSSDVWVAQYGPAGRLRWQTRFGTADYDWATAVSLASDRAVYIAGYTSGPLGGPPHGEEDAFVAKFAERSSPRSE